MILMECVFDRKFRKWTPKREATPNLERYVPYINQLVIMKQPVQSYNKHKLPQLQSQNSRQKSNHYTTKHTSKHTSYRKNK